MIIALMIVLLRGWRGKNRNKITKIVSVALHISGTIYHIIVINDDISWRFFHFLKNFEFLACQVKGQKITKMKNNYIHHTPYIRNSIAYDHDFWYIYISIYSRYIYIYMLVYLYMLVYIDIPAQWPICHIKLTVTTNAWYIFWHVRLVLSSMLVVPQIVSDIVGTITNVMTENLQEGRLVCKNIFLNILIVKGIMGSYMMF